MIEPGHPTLSIGKQCALLSISRSSFYYTPKGETEMNLDPDAPDRPSSSWRPRSSASGR
jgi:hypothetical protein